MRGYIKGAVCEAGMTHDFCDVDSLKATLSKQPFS